MRISRNYSVSPMMPSIDLDPKRNLSLNENRWIQMHELLSWIDGILGIYGGEDNAPFEVASLFRHLIRVFSGVEGNVFSGDYLYYIRHDHIEMQYRFYRMKGNDSGFYIDTIEMFRDGTWVDRHDEQEHVVFLMDDASGEILADDHEDKTSVDENQYINIILGGESQ